MGINRLLIDSRIQGFWHGHTKTGWDRRRQGGAGGGGHTPPNQGCQSAAAVSALGGLSNDSMGGPSVHSNVDRVTSMQMRLRVTDAWSS